MRPAVLDRVVAGMRLFDEEQFGPIVPIVRYEQLDEVVAWHLRSLATLSDDPATWRQDAMRVVLRGSGDRPPILVEPRGEGQVRVTKPPEAADTGDIPVVWIPALQWGDSFGASAIFDEWVGPATYVAVTGTRDGHIELVRQLLEPHIRIAARFEVEMPWPGIDVPMLVTERRRWRSVRLACQ